MRSPGNCRFPFVSNQPQYSALYRIIEAEVVPTCRELGISQVVFSPIAQGVLTGKYQPGQPVPEGSRATDPDGSAFIKNLLTDDTLTRVQKLAPLAEAEGLTMAQLAVAWVLQNDNVATAITGGSRPEQVTDNAAAAGKKLSAETMAGIDEALGDAVEAGRLAGRQGVPKKRSPDERLGLSWRRWSSARAATTATRSGPGRTSACQGDAETWLGEFYPDLLDAGCRAVSLYEEDRLVSGPHADRSAGQP